MFNQKVKSILASHDISIYQLCAEIGIARSTYYDHYYRNFAGYEDKIMTAIKKLIKKNDKGDANHAD